MSIRSQTLLGFLTCLFLLAACGQKGPLFLPGRSSSFESMIPEQQPEEQEQDSEDDEEDNNSN